jgi:hypothetical protein
LDVFEIIVVFEETVEQKIVDLIVVGCLISAIGETVPQHSDVDLSPGRTR